MAEAPPRCGRPMRRMERAGRAVLEDPACGRPEGHPGVCRSEASLARIRDYERAPRRAQRRNLRRRLARAA